MVATGKTTARPVVSDASAAPRGLFGRLRYFLVTGLLAALLFVANLLAGCETTTEEPAVYYGPAPQEDAVTGEDLVPVYYGPAPTDVFEDVPQPGVDMTAVYYGPMPVDAVGQPDEPMVYYGPQPSDVAGADLPSVYYGPQPVDAVTGPDTPAVYYGPMPTDTVSGDWLPADDAGVAVYYGPMPVDAVTARDCLPAAWYGPPPCESDEQCVEWYGEGYVCDKNNTVDDPCGGTIAWPTCEPQ